MSKGMANQLKVGAVSWSGLAATGPVGNAVDVSNGEQNVAIEVATTTAGTSLTFTVEWSMDGTNFSQADGTAETFTAVTTAGRKVKTFPIKGAFVRLNATAVSGSFTGSANVLVL